MQNRGLEQTIAHVHFEQIDLPTDPASVHVACEPLGQMHPLACCDAGPSAGRRQRPPCRRASGRNQAADVRATIEPCQPLRHDSVTQNQRFQVRKCQNARAQGLRINHKLHESSLLFAKVEAVHEINIRVCSWRMSSQRRCTNEASLPEA